MKNLIKILLASFMIIIALAVVSAAVSVNKVEQDSMIPGEDGSLKITFKNEIGSDIKDFSVALNLESSSFSAVGSSQKTLDDFNEGDKELFSFTLSAKNSAEPGDYAIPYTLVYRYSNNSEKQETGKVWAKISSLTSLDYSLTLDKPIIGQKSRINVKIINKGFGEIKFVSVSASTFGIKLVSSDKVYIGVIDSDSIETASFEGFIEKTNPKVYATITYRDFENNEKTENVELEAKAYSLQDAQKLGLITSSKAGLLIIPVIALILFITVRKIIKNRKKAREKTL